MQSNQSRCCLRSKGATLVLVWYFFAVISIQPFFNPIFSTYIHTAIDPVVSGTIYGATAFLLLFYPLAGCLADIRWGRRKAVVNSLCFMFWSLIVVSILCCLAFISFIPVVVSKSVWTSMNTASAISLSVIFGPAIVFGITLFLCSYIVFSANIIQFGMDQLTDSPSDDSATFIHWYVLITCLGLVLSRFLNVWVVNIAVIPLALLGLGITLFIGHMHKEHWFLVEPASRNPYKLVYRVIKFAIKHKNPIWRSAFTYCEDELPSRIDLGKRKYGGPFTSEQVEDVKAFLGILSILFTLGPVFAVEVAAGDVVSKIAGHMDGTRKFTLHNGTIKSFFSSTGIITTLSAIIFILLYVSLPRHYIRKYIPGMLKRMGLGMFFRMLSALTTLAMDTVGHVKNVNVTSCFLASGYHSHNNYSSGHDMSSSVSMNINSSFLVIQNILNSISYVLVYNAAFEFICAQSPHAMKGLLIGIFFAIDGVFQLLEVLLLLIPFNWWRLSSNFPSCGFVYYLINVVIVLAGFVAYTQAARRYQYRQRDEPDNIYRYAEDYYEKIQDEYL